MKRITQPLGAAPEYHAFAMWRFGAALLIMAYHFLHYSDEVDAWARWFEHMLPLLDMFFMISGFLIYERYADKLRRPAAYLPFIWRRLARLYPLHAATTGFFILVGIAWQFGLIHSYAGAARYDWSTLPANILLMQGWGLTDALTFNYVSWSLSAEWFCYLAAPLVVFAALRAGAAGLIALAVIAYAGTEYAIAQGWTFGESMGETKTWGAYRAFASFALGALAVRLVDARPLAVRSHWWGWLMMALLIWMMFQNVEFYLIIALMVLALYLAGAAERQNPAGMQWSRPLMPVMAVSFGVYLWHPVIETIFMSLVWKRILAGWAPFSVEAFIILPCIVSIAVALVSCYCYEKPVGAWLAARYPAPNGALAGNKTARQGG